MKHPTLPRRARGFSLLELVIVLVILGTIMGLVAPRIFGNVEKAKQQEAKIKMEQLAGQLEILRLEAGRYPNSQEGLRALIEKPGSLEKWNGPYIKDPASLKDPWGNDFKYTSPGTKAAFEIVSLGADGKEGGEGENKDVAN
jgi:general secretion pathway protein G